jgi:hypothetical protein
MESAEPLQIRLHAVLLRRVDIDGGCLWDDSNVLNTIVADVSLESGLSLGTLGGFILGRILDVGRFEYRGFGLGEIWT